MQVCNKLAIMEKETFKTNLTTLFTSAITGLFLEKKTSQKNSINYTDLTVIPIIQQQIIFNNYFRFFDK